MADIFKGIGLGLAVALIAAASFHLGRIYPKNARISAVNEKVDTVFIRDTITLSKAVKIARRVTDTVRIPVHDTIRTMDTLFVLLEREALEWSDSLCTVYASGIRPSIDSVRHFTRTAYITREVPVPVKLHPHWALGVTAGYGASKEGISPFVGVGVSWIIASW